MIILAKKGKDNKKPLVIKNIDKILIAKILKVSNTIDLYNKYNWAISNSNIDVSENLGLTGIKKY